MNLPVSLSFKFFAPHNIPIPERETTHELEYSILNMSFYMQHVLLRLPEQVCILLEVTIFTSVLHSSNRSHTAVYFIFSALIQFECSGARRILQRYFPSYRHSHWLVIALVDISGILDTTVCNDRDSVFFAASAVHNSSDLRNTDTCNHTCGMIDPYPIPTLTASTPASIRAFVAAPVAGVTCDYLQFRICCLDLAYSLPGNVL